MWLATVLIVAVACKDALRLFKRGWALRGHTFAGVVRSEYLASFSIERVGRAGSKTASRKAVVLLDRAVQISGVVGEVELEENQGKVQVDGESCEIWTQPTLPTVPFAGAYIESSKVKGWPHQFTERIAQRDKIFVAGQLTNGRLSPLADGSMLLSRFDPRPYVWGRFFISLVTVFGLLAVPALCTYLVWNNEPNSPIAIAGGVLGLAYFLLAQPLGVWLREWVTFPHRALRTAMWLEPQAQ